MKIHSVKVKVLKGHAMAHIDFEYPNGEPAACSRHIELVFVDWVQSPQYREFMEASYAEYWRTYGHCNIHDVDWKLYEPLADRIGEAYIKEFEDENR